jgi:hypothetical protein
VETLDRDGVLAVVADLPLDLKKAGERDPRERTSLSVPQTQSPGPVQSNGKCLLERPAQSNEKPKALARSAVATPHVAT